MSQEALTIKKTLLGILILLVVGYGVFISRFLIQGPEITINNLDEETGAIISSEKTLFLEGNVSHSSFISINGRPIFIDESGYFNEKLLLSSSMSIINIYAKDKFGKEVQKKIDVLYKGDAEDMQYPKVALDSAETAETMRATDTSNADTDTQASTNARTSAGTDTTDTENATTTITQSSSSLDSPTGSSANTQSTSAQSAQMTPYSESQPES